MQIVLANPRGFCAGVDRAIEIVERALQLFGAPIYVRHEVVHNRHVVERLRDLGAVFVEELEEVPDGATVVFSAHGVSTAVEQEAARRGLQVFDATCPLVTKVHMEVIRFAREGARSDPDRPCRPPRSRRHDRPLRYQFRRPHLPGAEHRGCGADSQVRDPERLAFVTQTTLSVDDTAAIVEALRARFPSLQAPRREDICYATQNRQDAVKKLLERCDVLIVVGSRSSSNSNRLRELAERAGIPGYLVDGADDLQREWLDGKETVGVTAGASAPEVLVQQVVEQLRSWGGQTARGAGRARGARGVRPSEGAAHLRPALPYVTGCSLSDA